MFIIWLFLYIYYVPAWLICTCPFDAPSNVLKLMKRLKPMSWKIPQNGRAPSYFLDFVLACRKEVDNHLWYLSERLVVQAFFVNRISASDKQKMARAMMKCNNSTPNKSQLMPYYQIETFKPNYLRKRQLDNFQSFEYQCRLYCKAVLQSKTDFEKPSSGKWCSKKIFLKYSRNEQQKLSKRCYAWASFV